MRRVIKQIVAIPTNGSAIKSCHYHQHRPTTIAATTATTTTQSAQNRNFSQSISPSQQPFYRSSVGGGGGGGMGSGHGGSSSQLDRLESHAEQTPSNAMAQAAYMRKLNEMGQFEEVIRRYDSQHYARNKEVDYEYAQAVLGVTKHLLDSNGKPFRSTSATSTTTGRALSSGEISEKALKALLNNQALFAELLKTQQSSPHYQQQLQQLLQQQQQYNMNGDPSSYDSTSNSSGNERVNPLKRTFTSVTPSKRTFSRFLLYASAIFIVYYIVKSTTGMRDGGGGSSLLSNLSTQYEPITNTNKTFDDVKGIDECKEEVMEIVEFLRNREEYARLGAKLPRGVLLSGPPGTGKTLIAKAIAGEAGVPFFYASGSEFDGMLVGLGAKRIISLFEAAKKKSPAIIFIDEIDALGGKRGMTSENYHRQTINQFLSELDGFNTQDGIIVIGATNFLDVLDPALTRPGRFDKKIYVPLPSMSGRTDILKLYLSKIPTSPDLDLERIASRTVGFSGAELENLVNTASIRASKLKHEHLTNADIDHAFDRILMGLERRNLMDSKDRYVTAVHETGHALMTLLRDTDSELHKLTVLPRGQALGFAASLKRKDTVSISKAEMEAKIAVLMGGVVAEEIVFGKENVTSGASNDLERATSIARSMVEEYGMSSLGLGTFRVRNNKDGCSPETKREIDLEVRKILNDCYDMTKKDLLNNQTQLKKIADSLMKYETLTGHEVKLLLQGGALERKPTDDIQFSPTTAAATTTPVSSAAAATNKTPTAATVSSTITTDKH